jgi:ParB/RepB/Spo0J family partition protein
MSASAPTEISLSDIDPHPQNPRLVQREDVIEGIQASITQRGFDPAHAIIVRILDGRYQTISGHHRVEASKRAGLMFVPSWVREMDDETAYLELVRSNAQSELTALERGLHALHSGMEVKTYAESVGRARTSVQDEVKAARVADAVTNVRHELTSHFISLAVIHAAPRWLWSELVDKLIRDDLPVSEVRKLVSSLKDVCRGEDKQLHDTIFDVEWIARALVNGQRKAGDVSCLNQAADDAVADMATATKGEIEVEPYIAEWRENLLERRARSLNDLDHQTKVTIRQIIDKRRALQQAREALQREQEDKEAQEKRAEDEARMRAQKLFANVSLEQWKTLDAVTKGTLVNVGAISSKSEFNKQENDEIEWAQYSWNPVTGCLHDCPYCYARDIAVSTKMEKVYPHGFAPAFRPNALRAPYNTPLPKGREGDHRFRNVFTCSMADLFGRWVPAEWIESVLKTVRENPQWNFLFLTKFPKRMSEFDIPKNAWMGTTVDLQARVRNAEAAFSKVQSGVRWLSVEPLIEPLKFSRLDLFDWIVIGGASRSTKTPEWRPPFEWIMDLYQQARAAGTKVYMKTNLLGNRVLELPAGLPIQGDPTEAPKEFHYLGKQAEHLS